jgi:hypothetical protein
MSSWNEAYEKVQELSERCDAFFKRREDTQARKDARRQARRDGDTYAPSERSELRQGALSKQE